MDITGTQIKAARSLLNWTQQMLADRALVALTSLKALENGSSDPRRSTVSAVRQALEDAGIEFIPASAGRGEGVRLARSK